MQDIAESLSKYSTSIGRGLRGGGVWAGCFSRGEVAQRSKALTNTAVYQVQLGDRLVRGSKFSQGQNDLSMQPRPHASFRRAD